MKMKKAIAVTLAAVAACATMSFAGCGEQKQELIVYTEAGFAPWEFTKKGSTKVIGVDMEIAKYIADKYDWELKVINGSFDAIVAGKTTRWVLPVFRTAKAARKRLSFPISTGKTRTKLSFTKRIPTPPLRTARLQLRILKAQNSFIKRVRPAS